MILAMTLSLLLLLVWSAIMPKQQPVENKGVISNSLPAQNISKPAPLPPPVQPAVENQKLLNFEQDKFEASFVESLACLDSVRFKDYQSYQFPLRYAFALGDDSWKFNKLTSDSHSITFLYADQDKKITKKFTFHNSNYSILLEVHIENLTQAPLAVNLPLSLGMPEFSPKDANARYQNFIIGAKEKTSHITPKKNLDFSDVNFLALRDRYFCAIIGPEQESLSAYIRKISNKILK